MYFNRGRFNRAGPIYDAEITFQSQANVTASCTNDILCAAEIKSSGGITASLMADVCGGAAALGQSFLYGQIHVPQYVQAGISAGSGLYANGYSVGSNGVTMAGRAGLEAKCRTGVLIQSKVESAAEIRAQPLKVLFGAVQLPGAAVLVAAPRAVRSARAFFICRAYITAESIIAAIEELRLEGVGFAPGDQIEIDLCNYYAAKNGSQIMDLVSGNFFRLYPGENKFTWQDAAGERTVEVKFTYQNKYI